MNTALLYLALVTAFTGLMWVPYILDRMYRRGLIDAVGYPENPKPQSKWADRLKKAHANAVENLVVFGILVMIAQSIGAVGPLVASAAAAYFWARVVHAIAYVAAIPWVRTLAFLVGFAAQIIVARKVLVQLIG